MPIFSFGYAVAMSGPSSALARSLSHVKRLLKLALATQNGCAFTINQLIHAESIEFIAWFT
jgi:hypothetical protein